jgi:hypothetical protein
MSRARQISLSGGELSPSLHGRVDLTRYLTGAKTQRNCFTSSEGNIVSRPGTTFIGFIEGSPSLNAMVRLIPFIVSSDSTYVIEMSTKAKFIRNGAFIKESAKTIVSITNANPCVIEVTSHGYSSGDFITHTVPEIEELNGRDFFIVSLTADTYSIKYLEDGADVDSTLFDSYTSGGTAERIYNISSPFSVANLALLNYTQSVDVMTITRTGLDPRELTRTSSTSWAFSTITFEPQIDPPSEGWFGSFDTFNKYVVTSIDDETFEESLASSIHSFGDIAPTPSAVVTFSFDAVDGARFYNVYRRVNGVFGFVSEAAAVGSTVTFNDIGVPPDTTDTPPDSRNPFSDNGDEPSGVALIQQRRFFFNTTNNKEGIWGSRTGLYKNFTISTPIQDDDAVTFSMAGEKVNEVRHMINLRRPIVFTTDSENSLDGDSSGLITPFAINSNAHSYIGSSTTRPIVIGSTAIFIENGGTYIYAFEYDFNLNGYKTAELTVYSRHLVKNHTILDWAFQQKPDPIVWIIRDDGVLLGMTYDRENQIIAFHRHDFPGASVTSIAAVPEGSETAVYLTVLRTVNGNASHTIERMNTRIIDEIEDFVPLDSSLSYDGTIYDVGQNMTISGGTNWTYDELLTLTCSGSIFTSDDIGNGIHITGSDGTKIRFTISSYTSATVVKGFTDKTVPVAMRSVGQNTWGRAVDRVTGLWHLEGEYVSVVADGFVVASPNNSKYDLIQVVDGSITLSRPYVRIHVGLPFTCDFETLDIDTPEGETLMEENKNITSVRIRLNETRGVFAGGSPPSDDTVDPLEDLSELVVTHSESPDDPPPLITGVEEINIRGEWNSNGRVFFRQVDPLPMSIAVIAPVGYILPGREE